MHEHTVNSHTAESSPPLDSCYKTTHVDYPDEYCEPRCCESVYYSEVSKEEGPSSFETEGVSPVDCTSEMTSESWSNNVM